MKRSPVRTMWLAIFLALFPVTASAQQAMIVTGHVTHRRAPLGGVRVRIEQFRTERVTDTEGRYSILIPSSSVRGQTVTLTATLRDRHIPYLAQSVDISTELFNLNRAEYLEVLTARHELLESQLELVEMKQQQMVATVTLYQALGGGWRSTGLQPPDGTGADHKLTQGVKK